MKTVFLDRDGVISIFTPNDYIKKWEEFKFIDGAIEGLKKLYDNGYRLVIISNQAGVNKGLFTIDDLNDITERMKDILRKAGVKLAGVYYCTHTAEENCNCRKPKPGLFYKAVEEMRDIKLQDAFFIGDSEIDVQAGKSAGVKTIVVLSGKTKTAPEIENWDVKPDYIFSDLREAADFIIKGDENGKI
ncbi:MAG TPA: D-glycero-beta-D-manno-heptose 1,7-bisphosphate 7-phosphatase [bacterium]|nr:D-glycero-beta-D-manno-heptose 1,7-bisphosphate 7-phosphatase [bacterium]HPP30791.1 D-glycero-beta-D-manno-heptose 1,7-bisphosphate 7-phosphatase [bacterium]